jgi:hypothetical protein
MLPESRLGDASGTPVTSGVLTSPRFSLEGVSYMVRLIPTVHFSALQWYAALVLVWDGIYLSPSTSVSGKLTYHAKVTGLPPPPWTAPSDVTPPATAWRHTAPWACSGRQEAQNVIWLRLIKRPPSAGLAEERASGGPLSDLEGRGRSIRNVGGSGTKRD